MSNNISVNCRDIASVLKGYIGIRKQPFSYKHCLVFRINESAVNYKNDSGDLIPARLIIKESALNWQSF